MAKAKPKTLTITIRVRDDENKDRWLRLQSYLTRLGTNGTEDFLANVLPGWADGARERVRQGGMDL